MLNGIHDSRDLAEVLNAPAATSEDAVETPRDWLAGIWIAGNVYPLDPDATTEILAILADGTAAVRHVSQGEWCGVSHEHQSGIKYLAEHWCPAGREEWDDDDARGVIRDWRSVYVWDANGFAETKVYDSVEEAHQAYEREVQELTEMGNALNR